jgi:hypothetical protein
MNLIGSGMKLPWFTVSTIRQFFRCNEEYHEKSYWGYAALLPRFELSYFRMWISTSTVILVFLFFRNKDNSIQFNSNDILMWDIYSRYRSGSWQIYGHDAVQFSRLHIAAKESLFAEG